LPITPIRPRSTLRLDALVAVRTRQADRGMRGHDRSIRAGFVRPARHGTPPGFVRLSGWFGMSLDGAWLGPSRIREVAFGSGLRGNETLTIVP
jgi:hypothetical protein